MRWLSLLPLLLAPEQSAASQLHSQPSLSIIGDFTEVQHWLVQHSHRPSPSEEYQQHNSEFAMRARNEVKAAADVPEDLFLHEVLPYQHFDEPLDDWRGDFFQRLIAEPGVRSASTLKELAETVIPLAFVKLGNKVEFKSNMTPQAMAPISETLHLGHASCTGLSILVANALRSVGVPARIAGTAEWNKKTGGNHNWVEVWLGQNEGWHFIDAVPTTKVIWDQTWFSQDGTVQLAESKGIHGVYAPAWDQSDADANYTVTWRDPNLVVPAIDRTAFYKAIPLPQKL